MPPIVKLYIYCAEKVAHGSRYLLCQVKIPDGKNTRPVYLLGKNIKYKQTSTSLLLVIVGLSEESTIKNTAETNHYKLVLIVTGTVTDVPQTFPHP